MPIVVIGGQSRKVGKTSVVVGLIAALRDLHWTAIKITQHSHAPEVREEIDGSGTSDTSRFLAAGANHSWFVSVEPGKLAHSMPRVQEILASTQNAIIESNSALEFLKPDLYIPILDPEVRDFKEAAQRFLSRADAVLVRTAAASSPLLSKALPDAVSCVPIFEIHPPQYITPEIIEFVRSRL